MRFERLIAMVLLVPMRVNEERKDLSTMLLRQQLKWIDQQEFG